jgi:hypothetical protein
MFRRRQLARAQSAPRNPLTLVALAFCLVVLPAAAAATNLGSSSTATRSLPTVDVTVNPYTYSAAPERCQMAAWAKFASPATPWLAPYGPATPQRYLYVAPASDGASVQGGPPQAEWWIGFEHYFASPWKPDDNNGSYFNFHSVPATPGSDMTDDGVSPIHLNFPNIQDQYAPYPHYLMLMGDRDNGVNLQKYYQLPTPALDRWHSYTMHVVFGRTDGTTPRPGAVTIWMDGQKVLDIANVNTLRYGHDRNGHGAVQYMVDVWEGGPYLFGAPCRSIGASVYKSKLVAARFGRTLDEMLADTPAPAAAQWWTSTHIPGQPDYGDSVLTISPSSRTTTDYQLPAEFGGSGSGTPAAAPSAGAPAAQPAPTPTTSSPSAPAAQPVATPPAAETPAKATSPAVAATADGSVSGGGTSGTPASGRTPAVEWSGRSYTSPAPLRRAVEQTGSSWEFFLRFHAEAAASLGLRGAVWDDQTFYTRAAMRTWQQLHGQSYEGWQASHPTAAARLDPEASFQAYVVIASRPHPAGAGRLRVEAHAFTGSVVTVVVSDAESGRVLGTARARAAKGNVAMTVVLKRWNGRGSLQAEVRARLGRSSARMTARFSLSPDEMRTLASGR